MGDYTLDTIKGHGFAVGDQVEFYGMGSSEFGPAEEPTLCVLTKQGTKYVLTYTGEYGQHEWVFGPAAKVWASKVETSSAEDRATAYAKRHHLTKDDAAFIASEIETTTNDEGHGFSGHSRRPMECRLCGKPAEVHSTTTDEGSSRQMWIKARTPLVTDQIKTWGARTANVLKAIAKLGGTVNAWDLGSGRGWHKTAVRIVKDSGALIQTNPGEIPATYTLTDMGRQACEWYGFTIAEPVMPAPIIALDDVETRADGAIGHVKANGRVFLAEVHNFGGADAFTLAAELGRLTLVEDGHMSRYVLTRRTADGVIITQGLPVWDYNLDAGTVDLKEISSDGWLHVRTIKGGRSLMNAERIATRHPFSRALASDVLAAMAKPADPIPANPEPFTDRDMRDQIVAYLGSDVDDFYVDGIVDHLIRTHNGAINLDDVDAGSWHRVVAVFHKPTEVEVWSGTGTLVKPPIRTALGRRKRKATKKARRAVKGGF